MKNPALRVARAVKSKPKQTASRDATTTILDTRPKFIVVDPSGKRRAPSVFMSKKKGGGASRRGSHRMSDAGGCEVRWYYSHFIKLQSGKSNYYMDFGTLNHTWLAYHYARKMERKPQWFIDEPDESVQLERDAIGHPQWLRDASDIKDFYTRKYDADPWNPLFNEEEFEATVGDIDPEGEDEPPIEVEYMGPCTGVVEGQFDDAGEPVLCANLDDEGRHLPHTVARVLRFPNLNSEIVTCRPDLIVEVNGGIWIIDHKTQGGGRGANSDRLPVINPEYPDYTYYWQAMVNLHIVRKGRCVEVPEATKLPVKGFMFNRIKRDLPYDASRDIFDIPARQYQKVPKTIRAVIKRERDLAVKAATRPSDLIAAPWECQGRYACTYAKLCHVDSIEERNIRIRSDFIQG